VITNLEWCDIDSGLLTERGFRFWQLFDRYSKYLGGDYELTWLWTWKGLRFRRSRPQSRMGLIFLNLYTTQQVLVWFTITWQLLQIMLFGNLMFVSEIHANIATSDRVLFISNFRIIKWPSFLDWYMCILCRFHLQSIIVVYSRVVFVLFIPIFCP